MVSQVSQRCLTVTGFPDPSSPQPVRAYHQVALSLRYAEERMLARGADVSQATIRRWTVKVAPLINALVQNPNNEKGWWK